MPKSSILGTCRLCKEHSQLVNSHIIPEFLFRPLKESDGHFHVMSTDSKKAELKRQKGMTEKLLCANCDNYRLSKYEEHLARVLLGGIPIQIAQNERLLIVKDYDYKKVKNGILSLLWRMSVSKILFFEAVSLGPRHEEQLRLTLLNDLELEEEEYPVLLSAPLFNGIGLGDWTLQPDVIRMDGNRVYRCLISGLLFTYYVGSAPLNRFVSQLIIRRNGWNVVKSDVTEVPFLIDACMRLGDAASIRSHIKPRRQSRIQ